MCTVCMGAQMLSVRGAMQNVMRRCMRGTRVSNQPQQLCNDDDRDVDMLPYCCTTQAHKQHRPAPAACRYTTHDLRYL